MSFTANNFEDIFFKLIIFYSVWREVLGSWFFSRLEKMFINEGTAVVNTAI